MDIKLRRMVQMMAHNRKRRTSIRHAEILRDLLWTHPCFYQGEPTSPELRRAIAKVYSLTKRAHSSKTPPPSLDEFIQVEARIKTLLLPNDPSWEEK